MVKQLLLCLTCGVRSRCLELNIALPSKVYTHPEVSRFVLQVNKCCTGGTFMEYPLLGQIELFPYEFEPVDWALCNGRLLSISTNNALFTLIGTQFGGYGKTNFALPDLRGTEPIPGMNYFIALEGEYPTRP
jgi:hypothetical protein